MLKKYVPHVFSIAAISAAILIINFIVVIPYGVLTGNAGCITDYLSNMLFFEGGIILTTGAFLEFFSRSGSNKISRSLLTPYELLSKWDAFEASEQENSIKNRGGSGGWMLIFIGTIIGASSLVIVLMF